MTFGAVMGAAGVLFICLSLTWSARVWPLAAPARRSTGPGREPSAAASDRWSEFERQFRAYAEGDGGGSTAPRGRGSRPT